MSILTKVDGVENVHMLKGTSVIEMLQERVAAGKLLGSGSQILTFNYY